LLLLDQITQKNKNGYNQAKIKGDFQKNHKIKKIILKTAVAPIPCVLDFLKRDWLDSKEKSKKFNKQLQM
jgi:hypothetical protein